MYYYVAIEEDRLSDATIARVSFEIVYPSVDDEDLGDFEEVAKDCRGLAQSLFGKSGRSWLNVKEWERIIDCVFRFFAEEEGVENGSEGSESENEYDAEDEFVEGRK